MNKQHVIDAVTRDKTVPFAPMAHFTTMVSIEMMKKSGAKFPDVHTDAEKMARLGAMAYEEFGFESVKIPFDVAIEAETLGAEVDYGNLEIPPQIKHSFVKTADDLVMPTNLATAGRIPVVLESIRILKKRYPDVTVVGTVMGPVSIMSLMFGFNVILEWMLDEDESFHKGLAFCTNLSKQYAKLVEQAGADAMVLGEAAASASIFGQEHYMSNIAQYHRQLSVDLNIPLIAHICGRLTEYLPILSTINIDGIGFDQNTSMEQAHQILGTKVKTVGNVAPVEVVWKGTPELIEREVYKCLDSGVDLLTLGCCLPLQTPGENLRVFANSYKKYMHEKGFNVS
jgi:MtaA/CmuA family methyltransferase